MSCTSEGFAFRRQVSQSDNLPPELATPTFGLEPAVASNCPTAYAERILPGEEIYQRQALYHAQAQSLPRAANSESVCAADLALNLGSGVKHQKTKNCKIFGAPPGTRTLDPLIKSQLLYQLS